MASDLTLGKLLNRTVENYNHAYADPSCCSCCNPPTLMGREIHYLENCAAACVILAVFATLGLLVAAAGYLEGSYLDKLMWLTCVSGTLAIISVGITIYTIHTSYKVRATPLTQEQAQKLLDVESNNPNTKIWQNVSLLQGQANLGAFLKDYRQD